MKKRKLRLMAMALAVCMSVSSVCSAFAANVDGTDTAASTTAATEVTTTNEDSSNISNTDPTVTVTPVPTEGETTPEVTPDPEVTPEPEVSPTPEANPTSEDNTDTLDEILPSAVAVDWEKDASGIKCKKSSPAANENPYYVKEDGIVDINGSSYLFDENGYMVTGKVEFKAADLISGKLPAKAGTYFFTEVSTDASKPANDEPDKDLANFTAGKMIVNDFQKLDDNNTYYFNEKGVMSKTVGWLSINLNDGQGSEWYYFGSDAERKDITAGALRFGWIHQGKNWFFTDTKTGVMQTGWKDINNVRYYFRSGGYMEANSWKWIGGYCYKFNGSGSVATDWVKDGSHWYFLEKADTVKNGVVTLRKGAMAVNGWKAIRGHWFYFDKYGAVLEKRWLKTGGKWYYLKSGGYMAESWLQLGKTWYYLKPGNGAMVTGWKWINKYCYYFRANGSMASSTWIKSGNKYYWLRSGGSMPVNTWFKVAGNTYYADEYGARLQNKFKGKDGKGGYFKADGSYTQTWVYVNGARRYPGTTDWVKNSWKYIDGYKYRFNANGDLNQDVRGLVSGPYRVETNRARGIVTIYAQENGQYIIPVKAFLTSVGLPATPTPLGTFTATRSLRWQPLMGPSWGQYGTHVVGGIFFHSVAGGARSYYNVNPVSYNMLGSPASHGCMRLSVRDAKWIYNNCNGSTVRIFDGATNGPFDRPSNPYMSPSSNVDPTDTFDPM